MADWARSMPRSASGWLASKSCDCAKKTPLVTSCASRAGVSAGSCAACAAGMEDERAVTSARPNRPTAHARHAIRFMATPRPLSRIPRRLARRFDTEQGHRLRNLTRRGGRHFLDLGREYVCLLRGEPDASRFLVANVGDER